MQKNKTEFLILLLGWLMMLSSAQGASFDCAKASTKVEHLICGNAELSKLDDQMAKKYQEALKDKSKGRAIRRAQRMWLIERNNCLDVACVRSAYDQRLSSFDNSSISVNKTVHSKYVMIQGSGHAICEHILRRMNEEEVSLNKSVCGMDLLQSIPGVMLPKWERLDLKNYKLSFIRFLLATKVREESYSQVFNPSSSGDGDDIYVPSPEMTMFGEQITREQLEQIWRSAINNGDEFYRWDGAMHTPDETDALLVDISTNIYQRGCPKIKIVQFSSDLRMPKPLQIRNANWLIGPEAIPFKYRDQLYRMTNEEGFEMDPETHVRTVPTRSVAIDAVHHGHYCLIQTNFSSSR